MPARNERVSDDERQGALSALGEHFSKGRLDMSEYEERSARAAASVTFQELDDLFADLPLPHYETGLSVRETADSPAALTEAQAKQRKKRLSKIEEAGWAFAGLWVPFWFGIVSSLFGGIFDGLWFAAFLPMILMGAYSIIFDIMYSDDEDDEDDEYPTRRAKKRAKRAEREQHRRELPPSESA